MERFSPIRIAPPRVPMPTARKYSLGDGRVILFQETLLVPTRGSARIYRCSDGLAVMVQMEDTPDWGPLLHVSLSYPDRLPDWETVKAVRYAIFGNEVDVMMMLPVPADFVNFMPFCFHLWETPERWGITNKM